MYTALKQRRVVDKILTKVVVGYDLSQEFTGQYLFPDVPSDEMSGKIIKFGKEAYVIVNTKRAPGETVRSVGFPYSSDEFVLANRLLESKVPVEFVEETAKVPGINVKTRAVNIVMRKMRLEGEYDKAILATTASNYASGHTESLSGSSQWSDPTADVLTQIDDAKATIRAKTGREPNVLHLDYNAFKALKRNQAIKEHFKHAQKASITTEMMASYFDVETVVVAKAVYTATPGSPFEDVWGRNTVLAYVPPKSLQAKEYPSFGYNYVGASYPKVEKEYFRQEDRSWHNPVLFRDKAIITDNAAGFLFQNTTEA